MGRDLHHAVRREGSFPQLAWLCGRRRRSSLNAGIGFHRSPFDGPAVTPAHFFPGRKITAYAMFSVLAAGSFLFSLRLSSLAAGAAEIEPYSPEKACTAIKSGLRELADAERSEAL